MTDRDEVLGLLDELAKLIDRSAASSIEVEADGFALKVTRQTPSPASAGGPTVVREAVAEPETVQRVRATTVGIFSATREWQAGDEVKRGTVLGAIQSLGHMADITAPADGKIEEILVAAGAPVEYGQALFAITLR
ncbi:MAG: acetyl-CoA carboxylase biotin carboxyl carrier protein [Candidatus Limnocylindria bacterium]